MAKRFKAPEYVGRPNPVAQKLRSLAYGTRKQTGKTRRYNRADARRQTMREIA